MSAAARKIGRAAANTLAVLVVLVLALAFFSATLYVVVALARPYGEGGIIAGLFLGMALFIFLAALVSEFWPGDR